MWHHSLMPTRALILVALVAALSPQRSEAQRAEWNQPVEPFRIVGNVYYVGMAGVSAFLVRTPEGAVLIDGALPESAPLIAGNVKALGVELSDVKYLLNSHAHYDHAGGLAELKRLTGATLVVSAPDAGVVAQGAPDIPAVAVDRRIADGATIALGGTTLTAHLTPGHTKGCTTWTLTTEEDGREYDVLFHCSTSVVDTLVGNEAYPNIVADYERTFARLRGMKADVFLANHPMFFRMAEKRAKAGAGGPNPFVDPAELPRFNERQEAQFKAALEAARKTP